MSEIAPVSAVKGVSFEGADVSLKDRGAIGMVTIRGDFASAAFVKAVKDVTGCDMPEQRRYCGDADRGLAWMSPDELLYVCAYADAEGAAKALSDALAGEHHMALNVSDARTVLSVAGQGARELIAKGAPVDMSPQAFGTGDLRRTRIGQVAAAFWLGDDGFTLVCFRSVGAYVFDWLKASATEGARPGLY